VRTGRWIAASERLEIRDGAVTVCQRHRARSLIGCLIITGSLFWGTIGAAFGYAGIQALREMQVKIWSPAGLPVLFLVAAAAYCVIWSAWTACSCGGVTIDARAKTVTCWWGFGVPLVRRTLPLADFSAVAIRPMPQRIHLRHKVLFQVQLEGNKRKLAVDHSLSIASGDAFATASCIAAVTGLPVLDHGEV
jgi:hypothetical protein